MPRGDHGLPSGVPISLERVNRELWRRQQGSDTADASILETDTAHLVSSVRHSKTIGAPIAMIIQNRDWKNWTIPPC
jgi:chorismate synthase